MKKEIDLYNVNPYNPGAVPSVNNKKYYVKIPNDLIRSNLFYEYGINMIFFIVYLKLSINKTIDDRSSLIVSDVLTDCGYNVDQHKTGIYWDVLKSLAFLHVSNMIEFNDGFDLRDATMNKPIYVRLTSLFCTGNLYTQFYLDDYYKIIKNNVEFNVESIISVYLYVLSFTVNRRSDMPEEEFENSPSAFFGSIKTISEEIGLSMTTVLKIMHFLSDPDCFEDGVPLLIKREIGSYVPEGDKVPKNIPNVYVRNIPGWEDEIKLAVKYVKKMYWKNNFAPQRGGYKNRKGN